MIKPATPATPHCLLNFKLVAEVWKKVKQNVIGQLSINKFFDSIISSSRTSKIQNGRQRAPKWLTESGKGCTPWFLGTSVNFR